MCRRLGRFGCVEIYRKQTLKQKRTERDEKIIVIVLKETILAHDHTCCMQRTAGSIRLGQVDHFFYLKAVHEKRIAARCWCAHDPRLWCNTRHLYVVEVMGSILGPNNVIAKDSKMCTYCCYVKCASLIVWVGECIGPKQAQLMNHTQLGLSDNGHALKGWLSAMIGIKSLWSWEWSSERAIIKKNETFLDPGGLR